MSTLTAFQTALLTSGIAPVDIVCIGDSITESMLCAHRDDAWPQRLRDILRAHCFSQSVRGGLGYAPSYSVSSHVGDMWGRVGPGVSVDETLQTGLGRRMVRAAAGSSVWMGFTGTGADLLSTKTTDAQFTYTVDGGAPVSVDGRSATVVAGAIAQIRGLCDGNHTLTVAGAAGGAAYVEGAMIYRGDEAMGVRVWESGHSGATAASYNATTGWQGSLRAVPAPKLVMLMLGRNEYQLNIPVATFQADLQTLAATIKTLIPANCSLVLLAEHQRMPIAGQADQNLYTTAVASVAASVGAGYLDLSVAIGPPAEAIAAGLIEVGSGCHPLAPGHLAYATAIAAYVTAAGG